MEKFLNRITEWLDRILECEADAMKFILREFLFGTSLDLMLFLEDEKSYHKTKAKDPSLEEE